MTFFAEYLPDVSVFNAVLALLGGTCCFFGFALMRDAYRTSRTGRALGMRTILSIASGGLLGFMFCKFAYSNTREAHWLRVGPMRYTVATVTHSFFSRSGRKFVFTYRVGTYRGQGQGECGEACPAPGTRRYLRFAVKAPDVSELTPHYVPDTLIFISPSGWAKLP